MSVSKIQLKQEEQSNMCGVSTATRRRSLVDITKQSKAPADQSSSILLPNGEKATNGKKNVKGCVQHHYTDHAQDMDMMFKTEKAQVSKGGVSVPFPIKLHDMLEHIQNQEHELAHIVSWQPHGRCFLVHKPKLFADKVLGRFFQQKKYASFQRQLNLYGFNRITKGPDRGSYYHELFLRGKKFLCQGINRMKIKGTGARMASNPEQEPDFYKMQPLGVAHAISHLPRKKDWDNQPLIIKSDPLQTSSTITPSEDNEDEEVDTVFDGMRFHGINGIHASRRHSLMAIHRRNSLVLARELSRRNSLLTPGTTVDTFLEPQPDDNEFFKEMDMLASLGDSSITDDEMVDILDRIIK